jgi:flagellar M-ring protein FliF
MSDLLENLGAAWRRTGLVQRMLLIGLVLGCAAGAAWVVHWVSRPNMAMLYSGLSAEDAAKIVEKIGDQGIEYELAGGGTTIMVPREKVYGLRLSMASEGLPTGDQAGYSILDDESFGSSPFKQQVNYKRALEGELAKSIQLIDGVQGARVHVVRPEGAVLTREARRASATVVLQLRSGRRLSTASTAAIVHLVAGGVEELSPRDVVVVDSLGTLLTSGEEDGLAKRAGTFLDYKTQVEEYLSRKAEDLLTAALGANRASVRVAATIETASTNLTMEKYDAAQRVVSREEISSSSSTPTGSEDKPTAGAAEKEETISTDYLVPKTIEQKSEIPGRVTSLSVAAFVDLSRPESQGEDAAAAAPLSVTDVEGILRSALGLSDSDSLKVVPASFPRAPAPEAPEEPGLMTLPNILLIARHASLGLLAVGALLTLKMIGRRRPKNASEQAPVLAGATTGTDNLLPADSGDPEQLRTRITRALQDNPEEVKRLFLNWVEGEKGEA